MAWDTELQALAAALANVPSDDDIAVMRSELQAAERMIEALTERVPLLEAEHQAGSAVVGFGGRVGRPRGVWVVRADDIAGRRRDVLELTPSEVALVHGLMPTLIAALTDQASTRRAALARPDR